MSAYFSRPAICIDFDGVIHSYDKGWCGGEIDGSVLAAFFEWTEQAALTFKLAVFSPRSKDAALREVTSVWLLGHYRDWRIQDCTRTGAPRDVAHFEFANEKPAAFLTIDDRAIRFDGDWTAAALRPATLAAFRPWNYSSPAAEVAT
jgi:hypothetical protein